MNLDDLSPNSRLLVESFRLPGATGWVYAMERLFSDRLGAQGYTQFPEEVRERILCAWKDLKDTAGELEYPREPHGGAR